MMVIDWNMIIAGAVGSVPPSILAFAAWWQARKTDASVNGSLHELLEAVKGQAEAEGKLEEIEKQNGHKLDVIVKAQKGASKRKARVRKKK